MITINKYVIKDKDSDTWYTRKYKNSDKPNFVSSPGYARKFKCILIAKIRAMILGKCITELFTYYKMKMTKPFKFDANDDKISQFQLDVDYRSMELFHVTTKDGKSLKFTHTPLSGYITIYEDIDVIDVYLRKRT